MKMFNTMTTRSWSTRAGSVTTRRSSWPATTTPRGRHAAALAADLGWTDVFDLGDLTAARGLEMCLPLWLRISAQLGRAEFNIKVVR